MGFDRGRGRLLFNIDEGRLWSDRWEVTRLGFDRGERSWYEADQGGKICRDERTPEFCCQRDYVDEL